MSDASKVAIFLAVMLLLLSVFCCDMIGSFAEYEARYGPENCVEHDTNWQRYRACAEADDIKDAPWWCVGSDQPVPGHLEIVDD